MEVLLFTGRRFTAIIRHDQSVRLVLTMANLTRVCLLNLLNSTKVLIVHDIFDYQLLAFELLFFL